MKPLALLLVLVLAVAAAGCGSETEDYADQLRDALTPLQADLQQIGEQEPDSPQQVADSFEAIEKSLDEAAAEIESLDPPEDAADAQRNLVAAIEGFTADLGRLRSQLQGASIEEALSTLPEILPAVTQFQTELEDVERQFEDAGIDVSD